MEPLLLRLAEAARLCSVSRAKLYKMVREGHIPAVKFGRSLRIPYEGLKDSIESGSCAIDFTIGQKSTARKG
jgi:excisionase family DNA binding protein